MVILFLCFFVFQLSAQDLEGQFNAISTDSRWEYSGSYRIYADINGLWKLEAQAIEIDLKNNKNRTLFYRDGAALSIDHRQKSKCLTQKDIPPLENLQQSFGNMHNVDKEFVFPHIATQCDGNLKEIQFYGLSYLVCVDINGKLVSGFGKDFTVYFSPAKSNFEIPSKMNECPKATITLRKVKTQVMKEKKWWHQQMQNKNKITPKTCLFVHGSGQVGFQPPSTTFTDYWGDVHLYTTQCNKHSFIHIDTLNYGWDTELLQTSFCNFATADQEDKHLIQDKIIFSHSMGNLIIAGAIFNNTCKLDTTSTSWYSANKPANGSKVATDLFRICNSSGVEFEVAKLVGACTPEGLPSVAYHTLLPTYPKLQLVYPILQYYIKGAMCGTSPGGLNSIYSFPLELVAEITGLESPNDGLVWFDSCNIGMLGNDTDPTGLFYVGEINHADGTCRNGNGFWGGDRQPCEWYSGKV